MGLGWRGLSGNPNIKWKIVKSDGLDFTKWSIDSLLNNKMYRDPYFYSEKFRRKQLTQFWEVSKEEFIARTWHPDRVDKGWCLDEVEKRDRFELFGC